MTRLPQFLCLAKVVREKSRASIEDFLDCLEQVGATPGDILIENGIGPTSISRVTKSTRAKPV